MRLLLCFLLAIAGVGNASVLDQSKIGYAPLFQEDLEILELAEQTIDQKIKQYKERRDLYRAKAAIARNQGDRLQFQREDLLDAQMYWKKADAYDEIADQLQQMIDELEKEKQSSHG